jgi:transposase
MIKGGSDHHAPERVARSDTSNKDAKVRVRLPGKHANLHVHSGSPDALALRDFLLEQHVSTTLMKATSDYRKPFH